MLGHLRSYRKSEMILSDTFYICGFFFLSLHRIRVIRPSSGWCASFCLCVSVDRHPSAHSIDTNCRGLSAYIIRAVCCVATEGSFIGPYISRWTTPMTQSAVRAGLLETKPHQPHTTTQAPLLLLLRLLPHPPLTTTQPHPHGISVPTNT